MPTTSKTAKELTAKLSELVYSNRRLTVLTGAGISTDSGIPDYRGPNGTYTIQRDYKPIRYHEFTAKHSDEYRRRYWARSFLGYPRISQAQPNQSHQALAKLHGKVQIKGQRKPTEDGHEEHEECSQKVPFIKRLITQNVDSLHLKAGSPRSHLVEMHGTLRQVVCLTCNHVISRSKFQEYLEELNPDWVHLLKVSADAGGSANQNLMYTLGVDRLNVRPDGDRDLSSLNLHHSSFKYPSANVTFTTNMQLCKCHGECLYKPDVVFFGENMKQQVRDETFDSIRNSDALLVIGSSLEVYSAYRLVKMACDLNKLVMILNLGPPRASTLGHDVQHYNDRCGDILPEVVDNIINLRIA